MHSHNPRTFHSASSCIHNYHRNSYVIAHPPPAPPPHLDPTYTFPFHLTNLFILINHNIISLTHPTLSPTSQTLFAKPSIYNGCPKQNIITPSFLRHKRVSLFTILCDVAFAQPVFNCDHTWFMQDVLKIIMHFIYIMIVCKS